MAFLKCKMGLTEALGLIPSSTDRLTPIMDRHGFATLQSGVPAI
jgi:hypothetical protein